MISAYEFFKSAPKVELHVHLDAAFDTRLLYEVAQRDLASLPQEVCSIQRYTLEFISVRLRESDRKDQPLP